MHLQRPSHTPTQVKPSSNTRLQVTQLRLLTYNCQPLGKGSTRQELCEDMHELGVTVAALQGARWRSGDPRSEWVVRGRQRGPTYHYFSWGRPAANPILGVQLLVSSNLLQRATVHTRFDPPRGLHGRLGGLRLVCRDNGHEMDELFVAAYAPQERDNDQRQVFFQALLEILHAVPKRTRVWLLGDFNGHVGADLRGSAAGPQCQDVTNNNGAALVHACESAGLLLANSFSGWAPTCWSPDGQSSHCIDFVAICLGRGCFCAKPHYRSGGISMLCKLRLRMIQLQRPSCVIARSLCQQSRRLFSAALQGLRSRRDGIKLRPLCMTLLFDILPRVRRKRLKNLAPHIRLASSARRCDATVDGSC